MGGRRTGVRTEVGNSLLMTKRTEMELDNLNILMEMDMVGLGSCSSIPIEVAEL
jgi:hypothetical protein